MTDCVLVVVDMIRDDGDRQTKEIGYQTTGDVVTIMIGAGKLNKTMSRRIYVLTEN